MFFSIEKVRKAKDPSQLQMLKTQLDRLNALGGLKSIILSQCRNCFESCTATGGTPAGGAGLCASEVWDAGGYKS